MDPSDQKCAAIRPRAEGKIKSGFRYDVALFDGLSDTVFKNAGVNQAAPSKHTC